MLPEKAENKKENKMPWTGFVKSFIRMSTREKAKQLVNIIYQPLGYVGSSKLKSDELWKWSSERAIELIDEIISAIKITTGHCTLRKLDQHEVELDISYWEKVKAEILSKIE